MLSLQNTSSVDVVKEAVQTAEEMLREEGELAGQSGEDEMDKEESECMHACALRVPIGGGGVFGV